MASSFTPPPGFGRDDVEWMDDDELDDVGGRDVEQEGVDDTGASTDDRPSKRRNSAPSRRRPTSKGSPRSRSEGSRGRAPNPRRGPREPQPNRHRDLIPTNLLDRDALDVVHTLQANGHEAYLVGGCVRDLLVGLAPKDFDVATDAPPNRVKRLFRNARIIGRRFRLVHVRYSYDHVIETATFRGDPERIKQAEQRPPHEGASGGRRDWRNSVENIFGTAYEDAHRRDFTVNALFYDPHTDEVIDWVGGYDDIKEEVIRCIGDPYVRIEEDPVRMLRAVHFAKRMNFAIEPSLEEAMERSSNSIMDASNARLYVELIKMLSRSAGCETFKTLRDLGILEPWLPKLCAFIASTEIEDETSDPDRSSEESPAWVLGTRSPWGVLRAADTWDSKGHDVVPESLRLASLFGPYVLASWAKTIDSSRRRQPATPNRYVTRGYASFKHHVEDIFRPIARLMSIPRWAGHEMCDILWITMHMAWAPRNQYDRNLARRRAFPPALVFQHWLAVSADVEDEDVDAWYDAALDVGASTTMSRHSNPGGDRTSRRGGRGRSRSNRGSSSGRGPSGRRSRGKQGAPSGQTQGQERGQGRSDASPVASNDAGRVDKKSGTKRKGARPKRRRRPNSEAGSNMPPPPKRDPSS